MAAYSALLSLAQLIHDELLPRDQHDYASLCGKDQMVSLHQNIIDLQKFIELVPDRCTSMTRQLESRLTGLLYRLEDLIESNNVKGCSPILPPGDDITLLVFGRCIEEIRSIVQEAKEMEELFKQKMKAASVSAHNDQPTSSASIGDWRGSNHAKVGINEDLDLIVERVTSSVESLQIIPIVGMGGIGKTTLARAVYDDQEIRSHFDLCFWVTISQEFKVKDILQVLLKDQATTAEPLDAQVHKRLRNQRFLIVMDDMWHAEAWEGVMSAIPKDQTGSCVIITTRSSAVAAKVDALGPQHEMQLMNNETSWDLLSENVDICESCLPEFESVGRRIAKNCKGLPLKIVVVAGMLKSNMSKDYWEEVERNMNEAAAAPGDEKLDGVLSLSYDNLPPHLKSCFLYFGAYAEDERIDPEELILLWVAEGFVKPNATKTVEEIAEEYLEELVKRSLVLVWEKTYDGKIEECGIHDILRELSLIKAKEDKFLQCFTDSDAKHGVNFQNIITSQRRVSVHSTKYESLSFPDDDTCSKSTRSLLFMDESGPANEQLMALLSSRLKLLKVLHNVEVSRDPVFGHLSELTNLRFLSLMISTSDDDSSTTTLVVPESISNLQKLETLIVSSAEDDDVGLILPVDIWKIHKLRHIETGWTIKCTLVLPPTELSETYLVLQHLQTLYMARNLELTESLIVRMPNLKGLVISYNVGSDYVTDYRLENLVHLCQLEHLGLVVEPRPPARCLPADFVFPNNLKSLSLDRGPIFSSWEHMSSIVGSLPNLQSLELENDAVKGSTWEPEEDQFLQLKYLKMDQLELKCWVAECTHFPCLEELVLEFMEDLEEIPVDIGYIPTLQKLKVQYCSRGAHISAAEIKKEQKSLANHLLRVQIEGRGYMKEEDDGEDGYEDGDEEE